MVPVPTIRMVGNSRAGLGFTVGLHVSIAPCFALHFSIQLTFSSMHTALAFHPAKETKTAKSGSFTCASGKKDTASSRLPP
jgi:hypothetical protein